MKSRSTADTRRTWIVGSLLLGFLLLGVLRMKGYLTSAIPYGYDPGFYRYTVLAFAQHLPDLPGSELPGWVRSMHEPIFGILTDILVLIGYSPDAIVGPMLGFLSLMTGAMIFAFIRARASFRAAAFGFCLSMISIIQFQEYWWNYWRNMVGIILLLASFALLARRNRLSIFTVAALFAVHRASFLFFVIAFFIDAAYGVIIRKETHHYRNAAFFVAGVALALPLYKDQLPLLWNTVSPIVTTALGSSKSGTFLSTRYFLLLTGAYFIFLIPGLMHKIKERTIDLPFLGFVVGLVWSAFRLFFYNRMLVFFDIFMILSAAIVFEQYYLQAVPKKWSRIVIAGLFIVQIPYYLLHVQTFGQIRTIGENEFEIITKLDKMLPRDSVILSTHRFYTPWLVGYSDLKVLDPGIQDEQIWNEQQWEAFYYERDEARKCTMLEDFGKYAKRLVVFVGEYQKGEFVIPQSCMKPLLGTQQGYILYETTLRK